MKVLMYFYLQTFFGPNRRAQEKKKKNPNFKRNIENK